MQQKNPFAGIAGMKITVGLGLFAAFCMADWAAGQNAIVDRPIEDERLSFQTSAPWSPRVELNADVALVYGIGRAFPARMEDWKSHGYRTHIMTGVAWGGYQDYIHGRWDGTDHVDQSQQRKDGSLRAHGRDVPYISPGESYGKYLAEGVLKTLDAGAVAVCLEEPEFWVDAGWEANFKREWKTYYGDEWLAPDSSPDAQYRASKLKYYLYRRALSQVFDAVHQYAKAHGREIPCYVATHSLINYSQWRIVSPESSLLQVGCDGYIAQVWTGTSRTPNVYEGRLKERTFDTAFLEYGVMQNLVRASGRRVWYLNDPVEDNPRHNWVDYRTNWECTLTASLLQPEVWRYEIMPWPQRIFMRRYPSATQPSRTEPIPPDYETELQAVITAMGDMKQPAEANRWEYCGTQGVGVLMSDTMMFQRGGPQGSDEHLGNFYGLAMPLLKHGIPVEPVQIENATSPGFLDRYHVLLLTYEGQKPPTPEFHKALAAWVRQGGALLIVDDGKDPFNAVHDWWNAAPMSYKAPMEHLFAELGIAGDAGPWAHVGKGYVKLQPASPSALSYQKDGAEQIRKWTREGAALVGLDWKQANALVLRRGPYIVAAGLDESVNDMPAHEMNGRFVSLFETGLPVVKHVELTPGRKALLVDLDAFKGGYQGVIAAACRVTDQKVDDASIRFHAVGIANSHAVVCVAMASAPKSVLVGGKPLDAGSFDFADGLLRLRFVNDAKGLDGVIGR
ncbi:MAG TPA: hypothetical protein VIM11_20450 [Tepidisphaeraceae bacterium]|jgi:hypothetical protein